MIHQFYKYTIDLNNYQTRDLPKEVVEYNKSFERSLSTEIRRFQRELNWSEMWTISDVYDRLEKGYKFFVLRPKKQIKGWVWLSPEGEIMNLYVSKWKRRKGWGKKMVLVSIEEAWKQNYTSSFFRIDIWNKASQYCFEEVIRQVGCRVLECKTIEEEY